MYDVNYFIKKFQAIPEELWVTNVYTSLENDSAHCAMGHCGVNDSQILNAESNALAELFNLHLGFEEPFGPQIVNDYPATYPAISFLDRERDNTPKKRIMAALYKIRDMQTPELSSSTIETFLTPELCIQ